MIRMHPWKIIAIGFVLVLFGFLAPFLMVLKVIEASFVLSFISHGASVSGLLLGIIGAAMYSRLGKGK
ncbi:MAG: hypothetical protein H8E47_02060 [Anaerolineales bacterium]|nr:hypothetical protein [Anaerolineales bacterium]